MDFPKPEKKAKAKPKEMKRTPLKRSSGRTRFTTAQQHARKQFEIAYRKSVRPQYLLDLARRQGRLRRSDEALPGDTPRDKLRELLVREHPVCEIRAPGTECRASGGHLAVQIHHKQGRMRQKHAPHLLIDSEKMAGACPECHDFVESNRAWAYREGWLIPRNSSPD